MRQDQPPPDIKFKASAPPAPKFPTSRSSHLNHYKADLIVASVEDNTLVLKDRYEDPKKTSVIEAICRLLSRHVFGKKFKMFIPVFEEDMKEAIEGVMNKHHIGFRSGQ